MLKSEVTLTENKNRAKKGTMPNPTLDLSKIQLPVEDADKPADLKPDTTDEKPVIPETTTTQPAEKKEEVTTEKKDVTEEKKETIVEEKKTETPGDKKTEITTTQQTTTTQPQKPAEEVPFHKHPDWIKKQQENEDLKKRIDDLEGKVNQNQDPYISLKPAEAAEKRIRKEVEEGKFKPKDNLELLGKYQEYERYYTDQQSGKVNEAKKKVLQQIDATFTEMGIADQETQDKILNVVNKWMKDGMTGMSARSLIVAKEYLEAKGELGTKKETTTTITTPTDDAAKKKAEEEKAAKDAANKKITKSGGSAAKGGPAITVPNAHKKSIDEVVMELGSQLDSKPAQG